jgi:hypothetical protein
MNFPLPLSEMPNLSMYLYEYKDSIDPLNLKDILFFNKFGFLKIDLDISDEFISELENQMQISILKGDVSFKSKYYYYNYKNVIYDFHKENVLSNDLLYNATILDKLKVLFNKKPIPFHTMNSFVGEMSSMHNQLLHIDTFPSRYICKVFIALETTDLSNSTVKFSPKSHLMNRYTFEDFNIPYMEDSIERLRLYNKYITDIVRFNSFLVKPFKTKNVSALIMSPSLYHGERRIVDKDSSRFSQYNIYTFEGVDFMYSPVKSDILNNNIFKINLEI